MQLVSRKNWLLFLAAIGVVLMGIMAYNLTLKKRYVKTDSYQMEMEKMKDQSSSDDVDAIEQDLDNTDLENIDTELQDIDTELNQGYL